MDKIKTKENTAQDAAVFSTEEQQAANERFIDRGLLELYKEHRHELFVSQKIHELVEKEEEAIAADVVVRKILIELEATMASRNMMNEDREWLGKRINELHISLDKGEIVEQKNVLDALFLIRDLLFRLYPGKTIYEIEKELDIETIEDSLIKEQQENHHSQEERNGRTRAAARDLYSARYDWGYYPELFDELGLKVGEKEENDKKIRAKEAGYKGLIDSFLDEKKTAGIVAERKDYFEMLAEKMRNGTASKDEIIQYKLEYNKLRTQWFAKFIPAFEELAVYGDDETFVALWEHVWKLGKRAEWKREIVTDEDRREREEQLQALDRNPDEAVSKKGVGKEEIYEGNQLIDEALMILYPDAVKIIEGSTRLVDKEKLEEMLEMRKNSSLG